MVRFIMHREDPSKRFVPLIMQLPKRWDRTISLTLRNECRDCQWLSPMRAARDMVVRLGSNKAHENDEALYGWDLSSGAHDMACS